MSQLMMESTDALVAYKTNPHVDQRETGKAAAQILVKQLKGESKALQVFRQLPLAISIEQQLTSVDPCKHLWSYASELSKTAGILSISIVLGFPYADVVDMGSSIIVVSDNDILLANEIADQLQEYMISNKEKFNGIKQNINQLLATLSNLPKPILLLDMGDNVGGGSNGDSNYLLDALEPIEDCNYFICIYDPLAIAIAEKHSIGDSFTLQLGNRPDSQKSTLYEVVLEKMFDGKFTEETPRHGGQINFDMGRSAIVVTKGGNTVMLTSLRVPPYSLSQLTSFNINPTDFDVLIAKGVNAPIAAYKSICKAILQVNTPGVTQADMTQFTYQNRRKPLFPFEENIQS